MTQLRASPVLPATLKCLSWVDRFHRLGMPSVSRLLPDNFEVAQPCSFANHPSRCRLECPSVSIERRIVASHGARHTTGAAISLDEHALSASSVPQSPEKR